MKSPEAYEHVLRLSISSLLLWLSDFDAQEATRLTDVPAYGVSEERARRADLAKAVQEVVTDTASRLEQMRQTLDGGMPSAEAAWWANTYRREGAPDLKPPMVAFVEEAAPAVPTVPVQTPAEPSAVEPTAIVYLTNGTAVTLPLSVVNEHAILAAPVEAPLTVQPEGSVPGSYGILQYR